MTMPLVQKLFQIHDDNFGIACEKIVAYQAKYKRQYDKKHKVRKFDLKKGDKIQVKRTRTKKAKGGKTELIWKPRNSFYTIHKIHKRHKSIIVKNPHTGKILKTAHNFDNVRSFRGI